MNHEYYGPLILLAVAALFGFFALRGLKTGRLFGGLLMTIRKDQTPGVFNLALVCYLGLTVFALYEAIKLLLAFPGK